MCILKRARNVHEKIYDAQEMYVHITYHTNDFLNFIWSIYLYFLHFSIPFVYYFFIRTIFFMNKKILPIKMFGLSKDIPFFLLIFSLKYRYNMVTVYVFLLCLKVIRSRLRSQLTFIYNFISAHVLFDRINQNKHDVIIFLTETFTFTEKPAVLYLKLKFLTRSNSSKYHQMFPTFCRYIVRGIT